MSEIVFKVILVLEIIEIVARRQGRSQRRRIRLSVLAGKP